MKPLLDSPLHSRLHRHQAVPPVLGPAANQVSIRRLVRFFPSTGRMDYHVAAKLAGYFQRT